MRRLMRSANPEIIESMREGAKGKKPNKAAYGFTLPTNPFENVGRPGYEAQDRELFALWTVLSRSSPKRTPESTG